MTPGQARAALLERADAAGWVSWMDGELIECTPRQRRRFEAEQTRERAERQAEADRLRSIAALPDADLAWLLEMGWTPTRTAP